MAQSRITKQILVDRNKFDFGMGVQFDSLAYFMLRRGMWLPKTPQITLPLYLQLYAWDIWLWLLC